MVRVIVCLGLDIPVFMKDVLECEGMHVWCSAYTEFYFKVGRLQVKLTIPQGKGTQHVPVNSPNVNPPNGSGVMFEPNI
jgi:hypothetical protein